MRDEVTIIDYGVGNLGSIVNMIGRIGGTARVAKTVDEVMAGEKFILPGVGAFDHARKNLDQSGLISSLESKILNEKRPVLGICVGFQLLASRSDEGELPGLGWVDGEVLHFSKLVPDSNFKIPHMGWNRLRILKNSRLFERASETPRFYFVHSYFFKARNESDVLARSSYGHEFDAAIHKENIYGVQFHPEKSHQFGMKLLKGFLEV